MNIWTNLTVFFAFICIMEILLLRSKIDRLRNLTGYYNKLIKQRDGLVENLKEKQKMLLNLGKGIQKYKLENRNLKTVIKQLRLKLGRKNASNNV